MRRLVVTAFFSMRIIYDAPPALELSFGASEKARKQMRIASRKNNRRNYIFHFLSMGRDLLKVLAVCGPEGPALRARRAHSGPFGPACGPEGPARASVARPLYLKLLTRHTIKPGTRQAKIHRLDRQKSID